MKSIFDVRQLLKSFGCVIYTGDPEGDKELMLDELKELWEYGLIDSETYTKARQILLAHSYSK